MIFELIGSELAESEILLHMLSMSFFMYSSWRIAVLIE